MKSLLTIISVGAMLILGGCAMHPSDHRHGANCHHGNNHKHVHHNHHTDQIHYLQQHN